MNTFAPIVCVVVSLCVVLSMPTGRALHAMQKPQGGSIFLINITDVHSYTYSCSINQLVALSADRRSLLFYDIKKPESPDPPTPTSVKLPLPGELFTLSANGKQVVVSHDSYVSVILNHNHTHSIKTYPTLVIEASSVMIIEELACLIPASGQWTNIQCLNMDSGATCTCDNQEYAGSLGFADTVKKWVYVIEAVDPQSLQKYNVSRQSTAKTRCLEYLSDKSDVDTRYDYGQHLWFSYDGTRIFLENGLTLSASDDNLDMRPHGDFNSSFATYQYSYFSQSFKDPYVIAAIRSDANSTIHYYTWPYLTPMSSKTTLIPAPPQSKVNGAQEVHICDDLDTTYAVVKYTFSDGTTKIGVVGLD